MDPSWLYLVASVAVLLVSLSLHESAHAWTANRLGDPTARYLGRVTVNPLVHIDPFGTLLFPLLCFYAGGPVFGWAKPVPVNPNNLKRPHRDHALIAAAGPASNFVLAGVCLLALKLAGAAAPPLLSSALYTGLILNVVLAVFNLFPIPPLDGGWIISGIVPGLAGLFDWIRPYSFILLFLLLYTGAFSVALMPVLAFVQALAL